MRLSSIDHLTGTEYEVEVPEVSLPRDWNGLGRNLREVLSQQFREVLGELNYPSDMTPAQAVDFMGAHQARAEELVVRVRSRLGLGSTYQAWLLQILQYLALVGPFRSVLQDIATLREDLGYDAGRREELVDDYSEPTAEGVKPTEKAERVARRITEIVEKHRLPTAYERILRRIFYFGEERYEDEPVWRPVIVKGLGDVHRPPSLAAAFHKLGYEPLMELGVHLEARPTGDPRSGEARGVLVGSLGLHKRLSGLGDSVEDLATQFLPARGDFAVIGNLETFRVEDWRAVGKWLGAVKSQQKAGTYARSGRGHHGGKKVLGDMTWQDIERQSREHPDHESRLRSAYIETRLRALREEMGDQYDADAKEETKLASKLFHDRVRFWRKRRSTDSPKS